MSGILEKLNYNFFVAAFIPTLGFLLTAAFIFEPILPTELSTRLPLAFDSLTQGPLLFLVLSLILGYSLSSLNTFIYKLVEGYMVLERIPNSCWWQRRKARNLREQIQQAKEKLEIPDLSDAQYDRINDEIYYLESIYQSSFPSKVHSVLPTSFGNILRAAEQYPVERYSIDSVPLWPRLIHVMPDSYYDRMEQSNNGLAFVVNCMILSLALALLCTFASYYQWQTLQWSGEKFDERYQEYLQDTKPADQIDQEELVFENIEPLYFLDVEVSHQAQTIYRQRMWLYLALSAGALLTSLVFYNASLPVARQYGNLIRGAYDLFRFNLLDQLRLKKPKDSDTEKDLWRKISEFMVVGGIADAPLRFTYEHAGVESADGDAAER